MEIYLKKKIKIILTGASGFLGYRIIKRLSKEYDILAIYNKNKIIHKKVKSFQCDLKGKKIKRLFEIFNPDLLYLREVSIEM